MRSLVILFIGGFIFCACDSQKESGARSYYLSEQGSDSNTGRKDNPWRTIAKLNTVQFRPGDTISFESGQQFSGTLKLDSLDSGDTSHPVVIVSTSDTKATINGGDSSAFVLYKSKNVVIRNLHFKGSGRKGGNTQSGLVVSNSFDITVDSIEAEGFQKSGVLIFSSSRVAVNNVHAFDNGFSGINVSGNSSKSDCQDIHIIHSLAENNPGDPTNFTNHSGNGIIVGLCRKVLIEYCVATNNGWDMPRTGNGPVGIWAWEADSVTIQHCISYRNKTSKGGEDGGGFDLDGGITNSVIQYCLSYENEGSGIGIFQYPGASEWKNNTVRFNISENDGLVSAAHAGIYIWNGSKNQKEFTDCYVYNNTIFNSEGAAIRFATDSNRDRFYYYNNIFVSKESLLQGVSLHDTFLGNNWWNLLSGFNINGVADIGRWARQSRQEMKDGKVMGLNIDPVFDLHQPVRITDPLKLHFFVKYRLGETSLLRTSGLDLKAEVGIDPGGKDFNKNRLRSLGIGASL